MVIAERRDRKEYTPTYPMHSPTPQSSYYEKKLKRPKVFHGRYLKHLYFTPSVSFDMSSEKGLDVNVLGVGRDSVYIPVN